MSDQLRKVLFVEDDPDISLLAIMAMRDIGGLEVVHLASAEDALCQAAGIAPDMLLLDFSLGGMNGGELLAKLRAAPETAHIPAVFMTASVMPANVAKLKEIGAADVFKKPFDPIALADQLAAVYRRVRSKD